MTKLFCAVIVFLGNIIRSIIDYFTKPMSTPLDDLNAALDSVDGHLSNAETSAGLAITAVADAKNRVAALPAGTDLTAAIARVNGQDTRVQGLAAQFTQVASDAGQIAP